MTFELEKWARPHLLQLTPYSSARDEFKGTASVYLDANENSLGSVNGLANNRYPDPLQLKIKEKLAVLKNVAPEQIFLGNGSDEPIDLLIRGFCNPGMDAIIQMPPTYGMYQVSANINNVRIINVPLEPETFEMNPGHIIGAMNKYAKIIFVCSPNNPSANSLNREHILTLLNRFEGLVVVDEAYIDFSKEKSFIEELPMHENLVVLQTFSKAWGLANVRVGMAFASAEVVNFLNKIKPPYNISGPAQEAVLKALENPGKKDEMVNELLKERAFLEKEFPGRRHVEKIYPSDANFLLIKTDAAKEIYDYMIANGIVLRDRSKVRFCDGCLRVTVGTHDENLELLKAWDAMTF